jgi:murein DD-endopeptidase MepM/ murein hydrolase activator NlpD
MTVTYDIIENKWRIFVTYLGKFWFVLFGTVLFAAYSAEGGDLTACQKGYLNQSTSLYILPYSVGDSFVVGQGNCTDGSHSEDQSYAYDFDMPIGTIITASRSGTVLVVVDNFNENNQTPGQENYIIIEHKDSTISGYYHITLNGALVEVGSVVSQGDQIALSGNTGDSTEPHLHFEVATEEDGDTIPVNFRNTRIHSFGLNEYESYKSLFFTTIKGVEITPIVPTLELLPVANILKF